MMKLVLRICFFMMVFFIAAGWAYAQDDLKSNEKALGILRKSMSAHGGASAVENIKLSFKAINKSLVNEAQAWLSEPPFDLATIDRTYKIDYTGKEKIFISSTANRAAGDFLFGGTAVTINDEGFVYDVSWKEYDEIKVNLLTMTAFLPQVYIHEALKNPYAARFISETSDSYVLTVTGANGAFQQLTISKDSHLLHEVTFIRAANVYGDAESHVRFENYTPLESGLSMPRTVTTELKHRVFEVIENVYQIVDVKTDFTIAESERKLPDGYVKSDYSYRRPFEVHTLAENIYMIENVTSSTSRWSYNVLFAVFQDFVLVTEGVANDLISQKVIDKIKEVAPGKPIRYLVQTHHHGDHLGGIRGYIAEGTTVLTTTGNVELITRIAKAPYAGMPDRLSASPREPILQVVNGKYVIKDKALEVIIYDIGSPHAKEMLVVYFPRQKILYQSDLINAGEYDINATSRDFMEKLDKLGWKVNVMVGSHGKKINGDELAGLRQNQGK
jgi:glyoxylase-like metal-dependent hydrolase (beta-lactamase superfamily II)